MREFPADDSICFEHAEMWLATLDESGYSRSSRNPSCGMALTKPTVLILGAGASMPYGFPSSDELKERIISSLESFPKRAGPGTPLETLMHASGIDADHVEEFRDELAGAPHIT